METYGFHFRYRLCGEPPTIVEVTFKDTEVLHAGDLINMESGYADLAATGGDVGIIGAAVEYVSGTTLVSKIKVITDWDAVYAVTDANARVMGATLDITGTTGAQTVGATGDADLTVVANSAATEPTLVMITYTSHPLY
jgi:hypothetical protein